MALETVPEFKLVSIARSRRFAKSSELFSPSVDRRTPDGAGSARRDPRLVQPAAGSARPRTVARHGRRHDIDAAGPLQAQQQPAVVADAAAVVECRYEALECDAMRRQKHQHKYDVDSWRHR